MELSFCKNVIRTGECACPERLYNYNPECEIRRTRIVRIQIPQAIFFSDTPQNETEACKPIVVWNEAASMFLNSGL